MPARVTRAWRALMLRRVCVLIAGCLLMAAASGSSAQDRQPQSRPAQTAPAAPATSVPPHRVAVAGLVHGHALGFFTQNLRRTDIQIVGVAEPASQLASRYPDRYRLDR